MRELLGGKIELRAIARVTEFDVVDVFCPQVRPRSIWDHLQTLSTPV